MCGCKATNTVHRLKKSKIRLVLKEKKGYNAEILVKKSEKGVFRDRVCEM